MNAVQRVIAGMIENPPDNRPPMQLGLRISGVHGEVLDAVAERLGTSRTRLAVELVEAAIIEAGEYVGVRIVDHHDDEGDLVVGLFNDPREKKE